MASKIRILDEKTINQIAAGEVIENPASVVKELVDNAIDAHATKIVVEAVNSGRQLLRIQDNGSGMGHDDALLCIERYATSKIRSLEDLWALSTMGFRGEALSSIASISEFSLLTAPHLAGPDNVDQANGSLLQVAGGKILSHQKVKCLAGTTIEVKSLFYNVPARKKFLKSPAKDASDIVKILLHTALANPHVAFELILNHHREFSWDASSIEDRIKDALGFEFYSQLVSVSYEKNDIRIHGFVAQPTYSRPTRAQQYLFVNNRPVTSLGISGAVKGAYGSSLDSIRHPAFVLFVDVATNVLDVNVHPQKKEVRFSFEDELKQAIIHAVSHALFSRHNTLASINPSQSFSATATKSCSPDAASIGADSLLFEDKPQALASIEHVDYVPLSTSVYGAKLSENPQNKFQDIVYSVAEAADLAPEMTTQSSLQFTQMFLKETAHSVFVHAVFDDYIIADISWPTSYVLPEALQQEGLYILSVKRAISRLAFDSAQIDAHDSEKAVNKPSIQTLLVPVFLELSTNQAGRLRSVMDSLEQAGIVINDFGRSSFLIQAIPSYLESSLAADIIRTLLDSEEEIDGRDLTSNFSSGSALALTLAKACKTTKATKILSTEAATHVVKKLLECVNPFQCPVGDKIISILTKTELEKKFR